MKRIFDHQRCHERRCWHILSKWHEALFQQTNHYWLTNRLKRWSNPARLFLIQLPKTQKKWLTLTLDRTQLVKRSYSQNPQPKTPSHQPGQFLKPLEPAGFHHGDQLVRYIDIYETSDDSKLMVHSSLLPWNLTLF